MFIYRWIESLLVRWLRDRHGYGEPQQYHFFRCVACRRLVTWHIIHTGGCVCRETANVRPAVLRLRDKWRLICLPWTVTTRVTRLRGQMAIFRRHAVVEDAARARVQARPPVSA